MRNFQSNRVAKMFLTVPFVLLTVCALSVGNNAVAAGCGWFCGGSWRIFFSTADVVRDPPLKTATGTNKGCDYPNETPPSTTCSTSAGTTMVVHWEVSASLTAPICASAGITIGANVGQSVSHSYSASSGTTISSFCQTCKATLGLEYTRTSYILDCTCGSTSTVNGTVKKFTGEYTEATNGMQPIPPCKPTCPPAG